MKYSKSLWRGLTFYLDSRATDFLKNQAVGGSRYKYSSSSQGIGSSRFGSALNVSNTTGIGKCYGDNLFQSPSFSIASWINVSAIGNNQLFGREADASVVYQFNAYVATGTGVIAFRHYLAGSTQAVGSTNVVDGKWHNICLIRDFNVSLQIWLDGVLDGSIADNTNNPTPTGEPFQIGWDLYGSATFQVAHPMFFKRALSMAEVRQISKGALPNIKNEVYGIAGTSAGFKPWMCQRKSVVSRPYLQVV